MGVLSNLVRLKQSRNTERLTKERLTTERLTTEPTGGRNCSYQLGIRLSGLIVGAMVVTRGYLSS
jgi:hypothetical protein